MALIDDIEFYGRAVDAGDMPHADAARLLAQNSNGGLTGAGAVDCLAHWVAARSDMVALFRTVAEQSRQT